MSVGPRGCLAGVGSIRLVDWVVRLQICHRSVDEWDRLTTDLLQIEQEGSVPHWRWRAMGEKGGAMVERLWEETNNNDLGFQIGFGWKIGFRFKHSQNSKNLTQTLNRPPWKPTWFGRFRSGLGAKWTPLLDSTSRDWAVQWTTFTYEFVETKSKITCAFQKLGGTPFKDLICMNRHPSHPANKYTPWLKELDFWA